MTDSSHLSLCPGNVFSQRELSHPKSLHIPGANPHPIIIPHGCIATWPLRLKEVQLLGPSQLQSSLHPEGSSEALVLLHHSSTPPLPDSTSLTPQRCWSQGHSLRTLLHENVQFRIYFLGNTMGDRSLPQHPIRLGQISGPGNFQLHVTKTLTQNYLNILIFIVFHGESEVQASGLVDSSAQWHLQRPRCFSSLHSTDLKCWLHPQGVTR